MTADLTALHLRVETIARELEAIRREIGRAMNHAVIGGEVVPLSLMEKRAIQRAVAMCNRDNMKAAKALGISKTTMYRKLREYKAAEEAGK